jgi:hypothetical protein
MSHMTLTNTKILRGAWHKDSVDLRDNYAEGLSVIGHVIQCCIQVSRGCERLLALHLTDLHKRGFLDLPLLLEEIRKKVDGPPIIDGTTTPCAHTWNESIGIQVCSNCGITPELVEAYQAKKNSDGH